MDGEISRRNIIRLMVSMPVAAAIFKAVGDAAPAIPIRPLSPEIEVVFRVESTPVEVTAWGDKTRTYVPGDNHYFIDDSEVTEEQFNAGLAACGVSRG